ncbi:SH3 domain-containing protein [Peribacillus muralis]|uniref:SH3 domain-containing protein n=1 Tax=Peribacillus muralis TaxID=264697 RepID=UPI003D079687
MKKKPGLFSLILLLIMATIVPVNHAFGKEAGEITVTSNVVNVREGAGLSFPIVKKLAKGESYPIIKEEGDWFEIRIDSNETGWVANWLVERKSDSSFTKKGSGQGIITGSSVRVRTGPGTTFQTVGSLTKGTAVDIIEKNQNWTKIKTADFEGWVASDYLKTESASGSADKKDEDIKKEADTESVKTGVTLVDRLNVRSEPSKNSSTLGKLNKNTSVTVLRMENEWAEIDFQGGKGWIAESYIQMDENKVKKALVPAGDTARVTASSLHVRKTASLNAKVIGSVNKDETYTVLQTKGKMTQIQLSHSQKGWVVSWYLEKERVEEPKKKKMDIKGHKITIIHDGTILRSSASGNSGIVRQANEGETFSVIGMEGDWYSIKLKGEKKAYVAGWIVTLEGNSDQVQRQGVEKYLKDKTIVIDPGHGGRDSGTIGVGGTLEKNLTIRTAELLRDKLQAAGAKVILTRSGNTYVPLSSRVGTSHIHNADAFISLHYDSTMDQITSGITTYYYHDYQKGLASSLAHSFSSTMQVTNRGSRYGNYHVIRENKRVATLIELGYLSNPVEELTITSNEYQEGITSAIYNGLARYFK